MPVKYESELHEVNLVKENEEDEDFINNTKKANNRKTLAPLYVHMILMECTNRQKHLTYQEILDRLAGFPYEVEIERKALGRILHLLEEEDFLGVVNTRKGTWYEPHRWMDLIDECTGA